MTLRLGLDTDFHNQQLEFPTVTVCPIDPFDFEKLNKTAYQTMAEYEDTYDEYWPLLEALSRVSFATFGELFSTIEKLEQPKKLDGKIKMTLRQLVFRIAITCDGLFHSCVYKGEEASCCNYFTPLLTERGFCYSFNARYNSTADGE